MNSLIEDFQQERTKNSDLVICICGPSGAGKGTLGRFIADEMGISFYSAGDFFRNIADEKDLTVEELSEKADKQTDLEVDRRTLEKGLNEDCVIESRISAWVMGGYADFTIYVTAELDERAERVRQNLDERKAEEAGSLNQIKQRIKKRDEDNKNRYKDYYNIDMENKSIFDLVLDNTEMNIKQQNKLVKKALNKKLDDSI